MEAREHGGLDRFAGDGLDRRGKLDQKRAAQSLGNTQVFDEFPSTET